MAFISATQAVRDEIAARLNEVESDNTDYYTKGMNLCIDDVQRSFPENPYYLTSADRTLSSGTRQYTHLPTDYEKMDSLTYPAGDVTLRFLDPEVFDLIQPSATEGGTPVNYTTRGWGASARIEYYPAPGGSYTLHMSYFRRPTTVSASSAVPDLPPKYIELLILHGEARGLRRQGLRADAATVDAQYQALKEQMMDDLRRSTNEIRAFRGIRDVQRTAISNDPIANLFHLS